MSTPHVVFPVGLTYADILMQPYYSEILPAETDPSTQLAHSLQLKIPIMSAAMDTVTESAMAIAMAQAGGIGVIHKNMTPQQQAAEVAAVKVATADTEMATTDSQGRLCVAAACGPAANREERIAALVDAGVDVLIVDTAHGHSKGVLDTVTYIRETYPDIVVIGGNIATVAAVEALAQAGAHGVKVGIGPGSICTTRIVTGIGVPQFSAVLECSAAARKLGMITIADGGIRYSGDIAKALAAGADLIMLGSLLAGTDESPGELHMIEGKQLKFYRGMGSLGAMGVGGKERYGQANVAQDKFVPEGVEGAISYKGSLASQLHQLVGGVKSAMGYLGAANLEQMRHNVSFVQISPAALAESHPHSLQAFDTAPNYQ